MLKVHALVYRLLVGELPPGTVLHHLCENKRCCKPTHLEPLTPAEHLAKHPHEWRQVGSKKHSHCKAGHPFDEANTYVWRGQRNCRACNNEYTRRRRKSVAA